jgi:hypothetical protein
MLFRVTMSGPPLVAMSYWLSAADKVRYPIPT